MADGHSTVSQVGRWTVVCACLVSLCLALTAAASAETEIPYGPTAGRPLVLPEAQFATIAGRTLPQAGTPYIDGISDQSLPSWDGSFSGGYFSSFFHNVWTDGLSSHIALARYVVQWNVMSGGYPEYRAELESWYADVLDAGLAPEISLTSYDGILPSSPTEYQTRLEELLSRFQAIRYLEAWDEPNNTANLSAVTAAHYTNLAYSLCQGRDCTLIAGNFLDSPNVLAYEHEYEQALDPANPPDWGIHPYLAVKDRSASTVLDFRSSLPNGGAGDRIWFTEVGAYRCEDYGQYTVPGDREQAIDASWLVNRLMPAIEPRHVFYYEFLFKRRRPPPCNSSSPDTALYVPSGDPYAPDIPRPAASYVYDGRGTPSAYTGGAVVSNAEHMTLTASVYPGGFLNARYHFEYGATAGYGSYSPAGAAGSALKGVGVSFTVSGLTPGTTFHYRIVSWNAEGSAYGSDQTLTTPRRSG